MKAKKITPCYTVHLGKLDENCRCIMDAFGTEWGNVIYGYSVKTNHYMEIMRYMYDKYGWFIENVSDNEWRHSSDAGFDANRMILNGPLKGAALTQSLDGGAYVNLDNLDEVASFCDYIRIRDDVTCAYRVGIRVNCDLEAMIPGETTAGGAVSRFGICVENGDFEYALSMLKEVGVSLAGLHMHTSTKTRSLGVFSTLAEVVVELVERYDLKLRFVDIGGGFFGGQVVEGKPTMNQYAKAISDILKKKLDSKAVTLIVEPGASLVATCITYETAVKSVRDIRETYVVTMDGSVLHVNPFLAGRNQPFVMLDTDREDSVEMAQPVLSDAERAGVNTAEMMPRQVVCGCTCMENDRFACLENYRKLKVGDVLSFKYVGAYTMCFNSDFILERPRVFIEE